MVSDKSGVDSGFPPVNLRKVTKLDCITRQIGSDGPIFVKCAVCIKGRLSIFLAFPYHFQSTIHCHPNIRHYNCQVRHPLCVVK